MFSLEIDEYLKKNGFKEFSPKAVLFDMDGVLYDSMPNHAQSWHNSMKSFGLKIAPEEAYLYEGMRGVETIKLLARNQWKKELSDEVASQMYKEKSRWYASLPKAGKVPGVEDLMKKVKASNLKIVVVTGSGQQTLLSCLEKDFLGLVTKELIITSYDVKHGKPSPEPYLMGLKRAGIKPFEGIVIENAPLGVRSSVASKVFTIAVNTGPLKDETLKNEGANLVFHSMDEVSNIWDKLVFFKDQ